MEERSPAGWWDELSRSRVCRRSVDVDAVDLEHGGFEARLDILARAPLIRGRLGPDVELVSRALHGAAALEIGDVLTGAQVAPSGDANLAAVARAHHDCTVTHGVGSDNLVEPR